MYRRCGDDYIMRRSDKRVDWGFDEEIYRKSIGVLVIIPSSIIDIPDLQVFNKAPDYLK